MRCAITTTGGLISIEQYAAAPDPPQGLTCPGRAPTYRLNDPDSIAHLP